LPALSGYDRLVGAPPRVAREEAGVKGVFLWLLGIPIPIIILLYLFHVL
jgi:hypothetical protein